VEVAYRTGRGGLRAEGHEGVRLVAASPDRVTLDVGGVRHGFDVRIVPGATAADVYVDSPLGPVALRALPRFADPGDLVAPGSLLAPMPGTVVRVETGPGAAVAEGQTLLVLEAMKMEHRIAAPAAGVVAELNVAAGRRVEAGAVLAVIAVTTEGNPQ
jgi:propionyl-CoA carboxylase alpha chain